MEPVFELVNVGKSFGEFPALHDVSFRVEAGQTLALLGHNGAGKTVTVRLLSTLAWPTSGVVRVAGYDSRLDAVAIRRRTGVCLDQPLLWPDLTGLQVLQLLEQAYGVDRRTAMQRVGEVLERFRFEIPPDKLVSEYSLGMTRKLALATSLLHAPPAVLWDEPEIGLDALSRVALKELIADLRKQGRAVVVTTHAIELAEAIADVVGVLCQGRLVACDTPAHIRTLRGMNVSLERAFLALVEEGYVKGTSFEVTH